MVPYGVAYDTVKRTKKEKMMLLAGDLNRHVGCESDGYKGEHEMFGFRSRNAHSES